MKFYNQDKKTQIEKCTIPQCVSVTINPDDETPEQVFSRQESFLKLPENIKDKLVSEQVSNKIYEIGQRFQLSLLQTASIARSIRKYYFKEINLQQFARLYSDEMGINISQAERIAREVIVELVEDKKFNKEFDKNYENISIIPALKKYPQLGEQLVTEGVIKLKMFDEPVSPSIKNWLEDYFTVKGTDKHSVLERSDYLYNSPNAKRLNPEDKQKLSLILESYDNTGNLVVDVNRQNVIFSEHPSDHTSKNEDKFAFLREPNISRPNKTEAMDENRYIRGEIKMEDRMAATPARIVPTATVEPKPQPERIAQAVKSFSQAPVIPKQNIQKNLPIIDKTEKKPQGSSNSKNVVDLSEYM